MTAAEPKTAFGRKFARFLAMVAMCTAFALPPVLAAQIHTSVNQFAPPDPQSNEISGDFETKFFKAKIYLIEENGRLMMTKDKLDYFHHQTFAEDYSTKFNFKGHGWTAELAQPIRMAINTTYGMNGDVDTIIRASVDLTTTEFEQTREREGIATVHLQQSIGPFHRNQQLMSLEIADASNPNLVLYSSGSDLTVDTSKDMLSTPIRVTDGSFSIKPYIPPSVNWARQAPPDQYQIPVIDKNLN